MDIVIRPVNDRFLREVVFPALEMGVVSARMALERLLAVIGDERTRLLVEMLLERGVDGAFWSLEADAWLEALYRLLFREWTRTPGGWQTCAEYPCYAGRWDDTLHLAMMIDHPRYPYWDDEQSRMLREACLAAPTPDLGLAAFVAGLWDPLPRFAPHEVLSTTSPDRGVFKPDKQAVADWSFRPASTVSLWNRQLATRLGRLVKREEVRLRPLEAPETQDILDHWLGKQAAVPLLAAAFSGLGERASGWVQDIGALARLLRDAAARDQGLTCIVTRGSAPDRRLDL